MTYEELVEGVRLVTELAKAMERETTALRSDRKVAADIIAGLCQQFAYEGPSVDGYPSVTTGGLSTLEEAFEFLGWKDPHALPHARCDKPGCSARATIGWLEVGGPYRRTCYDHSDLAVK